MIQRVARVAAIAVCLGAGARPAVAQISSLGVTTTDAPLPGPSLLLGTYDVAFDDTHDVSLLVWFRDSPTAYMGQFVHFDGSLAGSPFQLMESPSTQYPKVVYGGGVFVVYTINKAQLVRYTGEDSSGGELVGAPLTYSGAPDYARTIIFNSVTNEFAVVFDCGQGGGHQQICLEHVGTDGARVGSSVVVSSDLPSTDSVLVHDTVRNRYLLVHPVQVIVSGLISVYQYADLLDGSSGAPLSAPQQVAFCEGCLFSWPQAVYQPESGDFLVAYRLDATIGLQHVTADGNPAGPPQMLGAASTDGSLFYDAVSKRSLLGFWRCDGACSAPYSAPGPQGVVLSSSGSVASSTFTLPGPLFPVLRATRSGQFMAVYPGQAHLSLERMTFSDPRTSTDIPQTHQIVPRSFTLQGWALDKGALTGTGVGVDAVHAWAFPSGGGAPTFLGAVAPDRQRDDVAALFGSQFAISGFTLPTTTLPAGDYTVVPYVHSTVTGDFSTGVSVPITVAATLPHMVLESPDSSQPAGASFSVEGWALDSAAALGTGPGVDAVHVWAFPTGGGAGLFVAALPLDRARPDVAAYFGSQFTTSGFHLDHVTLPPGTYQIVAYAHSAVVDDFTQSVSRFVTVTAPVPNPQMSVDAPTPNAIVPSNFTIGGWAIDAGAASGSGVAAVHVWAFPTNGGGAVFLGAAAYGGQRGDVGNLFGVAFAPSGFGLAAGGLAPGSYDLVVFALSTVTGTFNQSRTVRVTVQ